MLNEGGNRIASFVRLDELPKEYKHLKVLGRGATSITLLEENGKTVLVFTRDFMKLEWLVHGIKEIRGQVKKLGSYIKPFINKIEGIDKLPIYIIRMPLLYPLSQNNRRIVKKELKVFDDELYKRLSSKYKFTEVFVQLCSEWEELYPDSVLVPFCNFIIDYDPSQFRKDFGIRQFMQTIDGEIIFLDPVVSDEIIRIYLRNV